MCLQCRRPWFNSWVGKICWRRDRLPIPVFLGFPCGSAGKESAYKVGDLRLIPGLGRSPGDGKSYPLQYSGLENSMGSIVYEVTELDATFTFTYCISEYWVYLTVISISSGSLYGISSSSITWELVRSANSWASPQTHWNTLGMGSSNLCFSKASRGLWCSAKFWEPVIYISSSQSWLCIKIT